MTIDVAAAYITSGGTHALVILAVQLAIQAYVNSLGIGKPVIMAELVRVVANVTGVSNVVLATILVNGVFADFQPAVAQSAKVAAPTDFVITVAGDTVYP
jgi:hypothetical protein